MREKKLVRIGNSHGIVIDRVLMESYDITPETKFELTVEDRDTIKLKIKRDDTD